MSPSPVDPFSGNRFKRISTPGHSWYVIPFELLYELGCADDINEFSLMDASTGSAYVEEDDGMFIFDNACLKSGYRYSFIDIYTRSLEEYVALNEIPLETFNSDKVKEYLAVAGIVDARKV